MSNKAGQELTLEVAINNTAGALDECDNAITNICEHLGIPRNEPGQARTGPSKGESVLHDRIAEIGALAARCRVFACDLRSADEQLCLL